MQPTSGEMKRMAAPMLPSLNGSAPQIHLQELQNEHPTAAAAPPPHDDFFDQVLSSLPWVDLNTVNGKSPWDLAADNGGEAANGQKLFSVSLEGKPVLDDQSTGAEGLHYMSPYDESALLASRLRQHQISGGGPQGVRRPMIAGMGRSAAVGDSGLLSLPLSLGSGDSADSTLLVGDGLYSRFGGPLQRAAQAAAANQQHFHHPQNFGPPAATAGVAASGAAPPRQRVRARRGQATDPHSIAERLRRERIAERMKALQELVPNGNKTDKASMLDEIIDYVKFLQLQVKVLSMSRLGGAAAVAPLVVDISSEASAGRGNAASQAAAAGGDGLGTTESQVAKLMEQDIGSAMQYLQGKGLCLMPVSLASAISATAGGHHPRGGANSHGGNPMVVQGAADAPSSPSMSVLTVQSAVAKGGDARVSRPSAKDAASVPKP